MTNEADSMAADADRLRRFKQVFPILLMINGLGALDGQIVNTALPRIAADLQGLAHLSWIITAYMLAVTICMPLYGKLSDVFGRKPILAISVAIFLIGSALCAFAQTMPQLILFRAIQGLGGGGLFTVTSATIADFLTPRERGKYAGYNSMVFAACTVAGPVVGGILTSALGWRSVFWINLPLGVLVLVLLILVLPRGVQKERRKIDYLGVVLVAASAIPLMLALSWGGVEHAWTSPLILSLGAAVLVFGTLLGFQERRAPEPVLAVNLAGNPTVLWGGIAQGVVGFGYYGSIMFLPLFFQVVEGHTPMVSGLMILPQIAGNLIASIAGGRLISRTGRYKGILMISTAGLALAFAMMGLLTRYSAPIWSIEVTLLVLGVCGNMCILALMLAVQSAVTGRDLGAAISSTAFLNTLMGATGIAIAGSVMYRALASYLAERGLGAEMIQKLGAALRDGSLAATGQGALLHDAYRSAISLAFFFSAFVCALVLVPAWLVPNAPLSNKIDR